MADIQTQVDLANRALQHCGVRRIVALTDDSKAASEVNFCYDKLRKAELRRNVWSFATRKAALRAIDTTTTLLAPAAYNPATAYAVGSIVNYAGKNWQTNVATTGQQPGLDASPWELYAGPMTITAEAVTAGATVLANSYFAGELVLYSGVVYLSLIGNNDDIPPTANWLSLGAVSSALTILYPIGSGPSSQNNTRNIFHLPGAWLREAPQDPKAGSTSPLGAPAGLQYQDWEYENGYIVSASVDTMIYRFTADVTKVTNFDPMFCEGLAARVAFEVCETLTQSAEKLNTIGSAYNRFMTEARQVNGIETGASEPPEDDYISCRA